MRMMVGAFIVCIGIINSAQAYVWSECWPFTVKAKWSGASTDTYHIAQDSLTSGIKNATRGIFETVTLVSETKLDINTSYADDNDGKISNGDGRSEVGVVTDDAFYDIQDDDVAGVAWSNYVYDFISGDCEYVETDVSIPESSTSSASYYESVFMHELLHSVGAEHSTDYGNMLAYGGASSHQGDWNIKPFPDDTQGLGDQYSSGSSLTDLGTSHYQIIKEDTDDDGSEEYVMDSYLVENDFTVCPGDTIKPLITSLNFGTSTKSSVKNQIYVAEVPNDPSATVTKVMYSGVINNFSAHTDYVRELSFTVKSSGLTRDKTYYLYGKIDYNNDITESDETNNTDWIGYLKIDTVANCTNIGKVRVHKVDMSSIYKRVTSSKWAKINAAIPKAQYIVYGQIMGKTTEEKNGILQTSYEIKVAENYRGSKAGSTLKFIAIGGSLEVTAEGGKKQQKVQMMSHVPFLELGENYLLFLGNKSGNPYVGGAKMVFNAPKSGAGKYLMSMEGNKYFELSGSSLAYKSGISSHSCGGQCSDVSDAGTTVNTKNYDRTTPGKAILKTKFITKLKSSILSAPYTGDSSGLKTTISNNGMSLIKAVD